MKKSARFSLQSFVPARGYVLAGGMSSRFGSDKALADIGGKPMLVRACGMFKECPLPYAPTVVGDPLKYRSFADRCIADEWPSEGPLGGILTALKDSAECEYEIRTNIILGCDMPFLTTRWVLELLQRGLSSKADVVVPRSPAGLEPLCAVWRTGALPTLQEAFERGMRRVTEGIALLRAEVLDERDWKRFDSAGRLFWNMNTAADYEEARRIVEAGQG
jgi:molybdopterin-guanine dinucleotide biosynthesis protein A